MKRSRVLIAVAFSLTFLGITAYAQLLRYSTKVIQEVVETIDESDSIVVVWNERLADKTYRNAGYRLVGAKKEIFRDKLSSFLSLESPPSSSMSRPYLTVFCVHATEAPIEIFLKNGIGECRLNTVDRLKEIALEGEKVGNSELVLLEKNIDVGLRKDIFEREFVLRSKPVGR
jgi:hypothetical protein